MRVPDIILNCVGFINEFTEIAPDGHLDPIGTGFFVRFPSKANPQKFFYYFVTAKHVLQPFANGQTEAAITVNLKGGGVGFLKNIDNNWFIHPEANVDIAIAACSPMPDMAVQSLPLEMFVDGRILKEQNLGVGDEVFFPGLFTFFRSERWNVPILRHGNIAMLPPEDIQVGGGFSDVFLIEARSIGGISGSPVFVRGTYSARLPDGKALHGLSDHTYLLGLIHGHWDINESEINRAQLQHTPTGVNLGIAVVVPARKIQDNGCPDASWLG